MFADELKRRVGLTVVAFLFFSRKFKYFSNKIKWRTLKCLWSIVLFLVVIVAVGLALSQKNCVEALPKPKAKAI